METVNEKILHSNLNGILDRIAREQISTLITKDEQPVAVILPYEIYQQWIVTREKRLRQVYQGLKTWTTKHSDVLTGLDSAQLVREERDR